MCCETGPVAAMLERYRQLQTGEKVDWGDELGPFILQFSAPLVVERERLPAPGGGFLDGLRKALDEPRAGTVVARGSELRAGRRLYAIAGHRLRVPVAFDRPDGIELAILDGDGEVEIDGQRVRIADDAQSATLRLQSGVPARWSVVDDRGGAWFPDDRLPKWDFHGRPFFHGDDIELDVPAVALTVTVTRGMEYRYERTEVSPGAGETVTVELTPARLYDAAAKGWYGGDLHVHMNYSGDLVVTPHDCAAMQDGEGLHLMNLVAGNLLGSRVYDREAFEFHVGHDLPWSSHDHVARFGVEFRNDLLGHAHALNPSGPPTHYQTGHANSAHNEDWPPNAVALAELRELGATVGYTHPVFSTLETPADAFGFPWSVEARELVVDAALGLVDSMDLLGPSNTTGCTRLFHRLLGCGFPVAATAGTDVFLSFSHALGMSNPPGWARVYADLQGASLTVASFQDAVRARRTMATNGPWLELQVDEEGPGAVLDVTEGSELRVVARWDGVGVELLEIVGAGGVIASTAGREVAATVRVDEPTWIAAKATGREHEAVLSPDVFAHTSAVFVDVGGRRVGRAADARWCLEWLDLFEKLVRTHGRFHSPDHLDELIDLTDQARAIYRAIAEPS